MEQDDDTAEHPMPGHQMAGHQMVDHEMAGRQLAGQLADPTADDPTAERLIAERLVGECDRWLTAGPAAATRFPPLLEARYEADTRRARSRAKATVCLLGAGIGGLLLLLYVLLHRGPVPLGAWGPPACVWIVLAASGALLLRDPPAGVRTALGLAAAIAATVGVNVNYLTDPGFRPTTYVASTMLALIGAGVALRLPPRPTAFFALVVVGGVAAMLPGHKGVDMAEALQVAATALCVAVFVVYANWRQHAERRRAYALTLRDGLRQSALARRNAELDELARRDALTGLANRRAYDSWARAVWQRAAEAGRPVGLIVVDIDRFKAYNDFHGHAAGDTCLQAVSTSLREQLRGTSDKVARLGGEEFAILLPGLGRDLCADIAERLRLAVAALELPHPMGEAQVVTISAGVASLKAEEAAGPDALFALADAALYAAKQAGRNRIRIAHTTQERAPIFKE